MKNEASWLMLTKPSHLSSFGESPSEPVTLRRFRCPIMRETSVLMVGSSRTSHDRQLRILRSDVQWDQLNYISSTPHQRFDATQQTPVVRGIRIVRGSPDALHTLGTGALQITRQTCDFCGHQPVELLMYVIGQNGVGW